MGYHLTLGSSFIHTREYPYCPVTPEIVLIRQRVNLHTKTLLLFFYTPGSILIDTRKYPYYPYITGSFLTHQRVSSHTKSISHTMEHPYILKSILFPPWSKLWSSCTYHHTGNWYSYISEASGHTREYFYTPRVSFLGTIISKW